MANDDQNSNESEEDLELYGAAITARKATGKDDEEGEIPVHDVDFLYDVPLKMLVEVGHTEMTISEILKLKKGAIVEFQKIVGEPMDIIVGGRLMARGEVVVVNERYGIRISEITRPEETGSIFG